MPYDDMSYDTALSAVKKSTNTGPTLVPVSQTSPREAVDLSGIPIDLSNYFLIEKVVPKQYSW